jgi:hypothetical protein
LCTKATETKLLSAAKKCITEWFGEDPKKSEDLARIVSDRHFDRLVKLLQSSKATVAYGNIS